MPLMPGNPLVVCEVCGKSWSSFSSNNRPLCEKCFEDRNKFVGSAMDRAAEEAYKAWDLSHPKKFEVVVSEVQE